MVLAVTLVVAVVWYLSRMDLSVHHWEIFDAVILGTLSSSQVLTYLHLTIVAIDRYIYISKPFYYITNTTQTPTFRLVLSVWSFSLLCFAVPIIFYGGSNYHKQCILLHPPVEYFSSLTLLGIICYVIVCVCYIRIALLAFERKQAKISRRQPNDSLNASAFVTSTGKAAIRSIQFCVAMFGITAACYIPLGVVITLSRLSNKNSMEAFIPSLYMIHIHSLANFVTHLDMNKDFCVGVQKQFPQCY